MAVTESRAKKLVAGIKSLLKRTVKVGEAKTPKLALVEARKEGKKITPAMLEKSAKTHLWMHFTRHGSFANKEIPIMAKAEGHYVYDVHGKKYIDGLSGLFSSLFSH